MKKIIYIDYTNGVNSTENTKFHGGGDFGRMMTHKLIDVIKTKKYDSKVIIIWPLNCMPKTKEEEEIYYSKNLEILQAKSLVDIKYEKESNVFIPLIPNTNLHILKNIKIKNPNINIYCVIHGVRLLDLKKYDKYDRYYYNGYKSLPYITWIRRNIAGILSKNHLRKYLKYADKIFTVSNNSLQEITKYHNAKYIKYLYRNSKPISLEEPKNPSDDKYVLFVNSNRYEKNFIRSLVAFCKYKKESNDELYLYALGINKEFEKKIVESNLVDKNILSKWVKFFDYVTEEQLRDLYKQCRFLLYTSKSEGFGLPPLEAMEAGRPTVASYVSSVPEVLGFSAYYVDPYSEEAIADAIKYMAKEENQNYYIEMLEELKPNLRLKGELDTKYLAEELLR